MPMAGNWDFAYYGCLSADLATRLGGSFTRETRADRSGGGEPANERRNTSGLPRRKGALRLWEHVRNAVDAQGRTDTRGNLFELPPIFHGQAEADRHGGARGTFPTQVCRRRSEEEAVTLRDLR